MRAEIVLEQRPGQCADDRLPELWSDTIPRSRRDFPMAGLPTQSLGEVRPQRERADDSLPRKLFCGLLHGQDEVPDLRINLAFPPLAVERPIVADVRLEVVTLQMWAK